MKNNADVLFEPGVQLDTPTMADILYRQISICYIYCLISRDVDSIFRTPNLYLMESKFMYFRTSHIFSTCEYFSSYLCIWVKKSTNFVSERLPYYFDLIRVTLVSWASLPCGDELPWLIRWSAFVRMLDQPVVGQPWWTFPDNRFNELSRYLANNNEYWHTFCVANLENELLWGKINSFSIRFGKRVIKPYWNNTAKQTVSLNKY